MDRLSWFVVIDLMKRLIADNWFSSFSGFSGTLWFCGGVRAVFELRPKTTV
jgi:hypothetical protein